MSTCIQLDIQDVLHPHYKPPFLRSSGLDQAPQLPIYLYKLPSKNKDTDRLTELKPGGGCVNVGALVFNLQGFPTVTLQTIITREFERKHALLFST